jgi:hypothetical protein
MTGGASALLRTTDEVERDEADLRPDERARFVFAMTRKGEVSRTPSQANFARRARAHPHTTKSLNRLMYSANVGLNPLNPVRIRGAKRPVVVDDGRSTQHDPISALHEELLCLCARPYRTGGKNPNIVRHRLAKQRDGMRIGALRRVVERVPQRQVDEISPVFRQPASGLHAFVEIESTSITEVFGRQSHAHGE